MRAMDLDQLHELRTLELQRVWPALPRGGRILEIGAGAGWQAKALADQGFAVEAVDIEGSRYAQQRVWPVRIYDGQHLPFADGFFDVVFSSNVLEHIAHVDEFQSEIRRVLTSNGSAVHVVPTACWRFWTLVTFYVTLPRRLLLAAVARWKRRGRSASSAAEVALRAEVDGAEKARAQQPAVSGPRRLLAVLVPSRHGVAGNAVSELYLFSRFRWTTLFRRTGWKILECYPARLLYTGHSLLGGWLPVGPRHILSYLLGSSCRVYVLGVKPGGS